MKSFGFLLVVLSSLGSFAATLRVPQDFLTVQGALAASVSGDSIAVSAGLYAIPASPCTLANGSQSTCGLVLHDGTALVGSGPAQTVLDFSGAQIGILLQNGTATVKLFHLQNANTTIYAYVGSNITAKNIIITNSNLGMELNQGNSYTVINTTIVGSHDATQTGSAIDVPFGGVANIQNNLVTNSDRGFTAGSFSFGTYAFNDVFGSHAFDWGVCSAAGCNAVTAPANNVSSDPLYCPDYTLQASSPAKHAGNPAILNSDGTRSDMGAYGGPEAIFPPTPCGGTGVPPNDFAINVEPGSRTIAQGETTSFRVGLTSGVGFDAFMTISVSGFPQNTMTAIINNAIETTPQGANAYVLISTTQGDSAQPATATLAGSYQLTISATGGGLTHLTTVTLNVQ